MFRSHISWSYFIVSKVTVILDGQINWQLFWIHWQRVSRRKSSRIADFDHEEPVWNKPKFNPQPYDPNHLCKYLSGKCRTVITPLDVQLYKSFIGSSLGCLPSACLFFCEQILPILNLHNYICSHKISRCYQFDVRMYIFFTWCLSLFTFHLGMPLLWFLNVLTNVTMGICG